MNAEPNGFSPEKAAYFLNGIAQGLSYLHERGIVHRDLKPGNIFYDDGYVKIGDYGLSKHISVSQHSGNTVSVGTVHYMAPEIGSGSYSKAIDIYSLGVILYEMLTGRLPFTGKSMGEISCGI
jgi:serine/threonine protein kinase